MKRYENPTMMFVIIHENDILTLSNEASGNALEKSWTDGADVNAG